MTGSSFMSMNSDMLTGLDCDGLPGIPGRGSIFQHPNRWRCMPVDDQMWGLAALPVDPSHMGLDGTRIVIAGPFQDSARSSCGGPTRN
jgi:hypothetical protein